jgi:nitroreductase
MKEKILDVLNWRYATKKFSDRKASDEDLKILIESARLAPSSFGLQPFKIFVIANKEIREKIKEAAWNQSQVTDCSHLVVFCARKDVDESYIKNYIKLISETRGISEENLKGFEDMLIGFRKARSDEFISEWCKRQSYISLGFLLETAALMKIDACPMEGFSPEKVDEILGLEEYTSVAFCALGYRDESDENASMKKVRFDEKDFAEFL